MPDPIVERLAREQVAYILRGGNRGQPLEAGVKKVIRAAFLEAAKVARETDWSPSVRDRIADRLEEIARGG
jgi:hypothetical protein